MPNKLIEAKVLRLRMEDFVARREQHRAAAYCAIREEPSSATTQSWGFPCMI
jgi:hypothetical protein